MQGTATRRLKRLAALLEPQVAPYYVRRPLPPGLRRSFPAEGWYWVPQGHHVAVFLGASEIDAAVTLHELIDQRIDEAAE